MSDVLAFGGWLKQRRKERDVGLEVLANRIGCSAVALYKIEAGERRPSRQVAQLLAQELGVPDDEQEAFIAFARSGQTNMVSSDGSTPAPETPTPATNSPSPWRTTRRHKTNLPHLLTHLIGRDKEVEEAHNLLMRSRVRLLTLTGPPGIGKTRLAIEIASQMLDNFDDGVFLVELAAVDDPDFILTAIARALGLKESGEQTIDEALFGYLRERRVLLVLDNFEHLLDAGPALAKLMEGSPWLKALATSREALYLRGERRYSVPPLALPDMNAPITVEALRNQPSVVLFVERAEEADSEFELTADNAADVVGVVNRLEGLPLAIELAAARTDQLSPRGMRSSIDSRLALGRPGARDLPPRQRTLLSSIEWSYNLLNAEEQRVFRSLGVVAGGFTLSAMEVIHGNGGGSHGQPSSVGEVLFSLASKNLIRLQKGDTQRNPDEEDRYAVLEAIREYALHMLTGTDEEANARLLHARYFLSLAQEANSHQSGPRQLPLLDLMDADYSNVIAGFSWLMSNGRNDPEIAEMAVLMGSFLFYYWDWRGYFTEGREWLAKAAELGNRVVWQRGEEDGAPAQVEPRLLKIQGRLLNGAGLLAWNQGDLVAATSHFREGLKAVTEIDNKQGMSAVLNNIAILEAEQGRYEQAIEIYEQVLEIDRQLGEPRIAVTINNLGVAYWDSGNVEKARATYRESLELYRQMDDPGNMVLALDNLGLVAEYDGDYATAKRYQEEALTICRTLGYNNSLAHVLSNMGSRAVSEGDFAAAKGYYNEVLPLSLQQSYNQVIFGCLEGIAQLCLKHERFLEAARLWGAAERMREDGKHPVSVIGSVKYRENVAEARAQVDVEEFEAVWGEGRRMSMQEAVGFALAQLG